MHQSKTPRLHVRVLAAMWVTYGTPAAMVVTQGTLAAMLVTDGTLAAAASPAAKPDSTRHAQTPAEVIAASSPADWRPLDPQNTLYMELPGGRVVIELAPLFAPRHVANIEALVREGFFDGAAIVRSQDNYVVQWANPDENRVVKKAQRKLAAEFERTSRGVTLTPLGDADTYAPEVGFADGFPAAVDTKFGRAWLVHCYGMVGAGRDNDVDSGGGTELYAVTGQAPRHLDRNVTLVGRVVLGMELLSSMPRGSGPLGFYEKPEQRTPIRTIRIAAEVPEAERTSLEVLRTDTPTFAAYVESRRNRHEEWFKVPAGHVDVCNIPLVSRPRSTANR